ncbi:MAG: hypothetical protein H0U46_10915 [Actinobacteria bacterium]|nr:hypothetical protein [Actinomycetota bacterium]
MSVSLFVQSLADFGPDRAGDLDARIRAAGHGGIDAVYVLAWPDYDPATAQHLAPQDNRDRWDDWGSRSGLPLWAWIVCSPDQDADATAIRALDIQLRPAGWKLNIETPLQNVPLTILIEAAVATDLPVSASLAGFSASGVWYDYRGLDNADVEVDWQAYFDSGEGPNPATAVSELYAPSFVIAGWQYRHRLGKVYGWGRVNRVESRLVARYDSFKRPGEIDGSFAVSEREWGWNVVSRTLRRDGKDVGMLMGRARYNRIRVTLDVTRTAAARLPDEWIPIAASSRIRGSAKRPVAVYLAETTSDDVIAAIAEGASA